MANNKIDRINKEIAKTREKITEYQNKLKGLEAQKTEAENLEIVQDVYKRQARYPIKTGTVAGKAAVKAFRFMDSTPHLQQFLLILLVFFADAIPISAIFGADWKIGQLQTFFKMGLCTVQEV